MTFKEFYEMNHPDDEGRVHVVEGTHIITGKDLSLFVVFSSENGWGIGTSAGIEWDEDAVTKNILSEVRDWLEYHYQSVEHTQEYDLQELIDEILIQISATFSSVDISTSSLSQFISALENDRSQEGIYYAQLSPQPEDNLGLDAFSKEDVDRPPHPLFLPAPVKLPHKKSVILITEDAGWRDWLRRAMAAARLFFVECSDLHQGSDYYYAAPHSSVILDARELTEKDVSLLRKMKDDHPNLNLIALVSQSCPHEEELFDFTHNIYAPPYSTLGLVRQLRRHFLSEEA